MADSLEEQMNLAVRVRRRLQAELVVQEACSDGERETARTQGKLKLVDEFIGRIQRQMEGESWWVPTNASAPNSGVVV